MEILTVKEVAKIIKASPAFVYKHYRELSGIRIAGIIRFNKLDFENKIGGANESKVNESGNVTE